jgi:hypothetical protein
VITVSMDHPEDRRKVLAFLKKQEASMQNWVSGMVDRDALVEAFDPSWSGALPYTVLLSPEGEVVRAELDRIDALSWRRAIVEAMNARKPW